MHSALQEETVRESTALVAMELNPRPMESVNVVRQNELKCFEKYKKTKNRKFFEAEFSEYRGLVNAVISQ